MNRFNQVSHLTRDTIRESDENRRKHHIQESQEASPLYHIQESQEASPFPAGNHKAARNRQDVQHNKDNHET